MLKRIQQHIARDPVDLCIVIGTSGTVYPAAGYVAPVAPRFRFQPHADTEISYSSQVKAQGGKVAIVDIDCSVRGDDADWLFEGDAAQVLYLSTFSPLTCADHDGQLIPTMLEPVIGKVFVPPEHPTVRECLAEQMRASQNSPPSPQSPQSPVMTPNWNSTLE